MRQLLVRILTPAALVLTSMPTRAEAQTSGLLLGIRMSASDSGTYRTYWIAPGNGTVRIVSGSDLIVPRRSGFWRVCVVSSHTLSDDELHEFDSVYAAPATASRDQCASTPDSVTEDEHARARCSASSETSILFVADGVVSREERQESNCGAHYSGGTNASLVSMDDGRAIDYASALGSAQARALLRATVRAARAEFADFGTVDTAPSEAGDGDGVAHLETEREWAIERGHGHWQTVGHALCSPYVACGDITRRFSVADFRAPRKLVGHDELSPSFASLKTRVPGLRDALSSPRRDLLVAITGDSLLVYSVQGGQLGRRLAGVAIDGQIVMAQWAVERFVPIWNDKLKELLKN